MTICNNKKCSLGECDQPETCAAYVPVITNADRIRSMSDEELAEFISGIAYGRENPWSNLFEEKCCKNCPITKCEISDYLNPIFLHECEFDDGKCPHGSDVEWWLQQPAEGQT